MTKFPEGPDLDWVKHRLNEFVEISAPIEHAIDIAGVLSAPVIEPKCGRDAAVAMVEGKIGPILNRLSPEWHSYGDAGGSDEFFAVREACKRLLARIEDSAETERRLASFDIAPSISTSSMHPKVWEAAKTQWNFGQHVAAVDAVAKMVNSLLQQKVGRRDLSEVKLFQEAFSEKEPEPGKPRLRFPHEPTPDSQKSKTRGVMQFGMGCFSAIRNPISHTPDEDIDMDEFEGLECLAAFSLLARWIDEADLTEAN